MIGHLREVVTLPDASGDRGGGQAATAGASRHRAALLRRGRYGVPAIPDFGTGYRYHITGLFHDETGFPTTSPAMLQTSTERLVNKVEATARR